MPQECLQQGSGGRYRKGRFQEEDAEGAGDIKPSPLGIWICSRTTHHLYLTFIVLVACLSCLTPETTAFPQRLMGSCPVVELNSRLPPEQ